jgi:hypothetical protein
MRHKMSASACRELIELRIADYQSGCRERRREILKEVVDLTGYSVKHAIKLLNHGFPSSSGRRRGRPAAYDDEVKCALIKLWEVSDYLCSKRLVPFLPELLGSLEHHGHMWLPDRVRSQLLSMSVSTADRLLAPERNRKPRGLGTTRPVRDFSRRIPIRTHNGPSRVVPGYFECDLVAHCGHSVRGSFLYTLVVTDLYTGWTDFEPISDRTAQNVVSAIALIRRRLPVRMLGLDTDNGAEFINEIVCEYCRAEQIFQERSRPYEKNDQAHVEQKNGSVVRRSVGYDRYSGQSALEALRDVYEVLRLHLNYFQPSMKLSEKTRSGDKATRKHDVARTPLRRLLAGDTLDPGQRERLTAELSELDPVVLTSRLNWAKERFHAYACTEEPALIERKIQPAVPGRKNCSSAIFSVVWPGVEKAFAKKKKVCIAHLFARLQKDYPGLLKEQQIHAFRRRVHEWQREATEQRAAAGGGGVHSVT